MTPKRHPSFAPERTSARLFVRSVGRFIFVGGLLLDGQRTCLVRTDGRHFFPSCDAWKSVEQLLRDLRCPRTFEVEAAFWERIRPSLDANTPLRAALAARGYCSLSTDEWLRPDGVRVRTDARRGTLLSAECLRTGEELSLRSELTHSLAPLVALDRWRSPTLPHSAATTRSAFERARAQALAECAEAPVPPPLPVSARQPLAIGSRSALVAALTESLARGERLGGSTWRTARSGAQLRVRDPLTNTRHEELESA